MQKGRIVCLSALVYVCISQGPVTYAADKFDNTGILYENDTATKFTLLTTNGKAMSYFGVVPEMDYLDLSKRTYLFKENFPGYDLPKTGDWLGTCAAGKTLTPPCDNFFTFKGGVEYTLFVENDHNRNGIFEPALFESVVFSTSALNVSSALQMKLIPGGSHWVDVDDRPNGDADFNDWKLHAETVIPEFPTQAAIPLFALFSLMIFRIRSKHLSHVMPSV